MSPLTFLLFRARYGWLLTVGAVLTVTLLQAGRMPIALVMAVATIAVSLSTFLRVDLPRYREMRQDPS